MVLTSNDMQAGLAKLSNWYHKIELAPGLVTPGRFPIAAASYGLPESLKGKRVLDVGALDGYWTIEAIKRGAREVVALDNFSASAGRSDTTTWENLDFALRALGLEDAPIHKQTMDVYDLSPDTVGLFDVVLCFGLLHHLRHPLLALERLSAVCSEELYIECAVLDRFSPYKGGLGQGYEGQQLVMEFYPGPQYQRDETVWWVPTLHCLGNMVRAVGFDDAQGWPLTDKPQGPRHCRGFVIGEKI